MTTTEAPKRQLWELQSMQAAPLSVKIALTKDRIREWVNQYGEDGVYVSFSGGKDSTVLLTIAREMYPDIKAVFVDTGLEYPEIRDFVRTWDNVEWLKPKLTFKQVIEKYGYPFIGKEVAQIIYECKVAINNGKQPPLYRMQKLNGEAIDKKTGEKSTYNIPQYKYLLEAPFAISHMCCKVMKKSPAHDYFKETGRKPILGQMAIESRLRRQHWLKYGCNGFDLKLPTSNPLAFWTEQDVLQYAKTRNVTLASVYGDIVNEDEDGIIWLGAGYPNMHLVRFDKKATGKDRFYACGIVGKSEYRCYFHASHYQNGKLYLGETDGFTPSLHVIDLKTI